jgi:hypothetical protein
MNTNCEKCGNRLIPIEESFQCERQCPDCGKNFYVFEVAEGGKGMQVRKGDRVFATPGAIKMSLDVEQSSGRFTRSGISYFAQMLYYRHQAKSPEQVHQMIDNFQEEAAAILERSPILNGLSFTRDEDVQIIIDTVTAHPNSVEHFALEALGGSIRCKNCLEENGVEEVIFAMSRLMNARSMIIFKDVLEKHVWSGYLVRSLRDILHVWRENKENDSESFWQDTLLSNSLVLSQVFSFPVVVFHDQAYVGGKGIENRGGRIVDFLLKNPVSENILLIEIKTPKSRLLGSLYRESTYNVHNDLSGAIIQVSTQRDSLIKEYHTLLSKELAKGQEGFQALNPHCLVISGNYQKEIMSCSPEEIPAKRNSFELYRNGLKDIQIITYDELFQKIEILLKMFEDA